MLEEATSLDFTYGEVTCGGEGEGLGGVFDHKAELHVIQYDEALASTASEV